MIILWTILIMIMAGIVYKYTKDKKKPATTKDDKTTKKCPHCQMDIPFKAKKCPHCQSDLKGLGQQRIGCGSVLAILFIITVTSIIIATIISNGEEKKETTGPSNEGNIIKKEQQITQEETAELSDEDEKLVIQATLEIYGIYNAGLQIADGRPNGGVKVLIVNYKSSASTPTELAVESGIIVGAYTSAVKNGWDIDELSVIVGDIWGNAVGMWYCSEEWTDEYVQGKITMEDLGAKVLTTMTTF